MSPDDFKMNWYFIDLDGTLAHPVWPNPGIGEPIGSGIRKLREVQEAGFEIFIYTARHWGDYKQIQAWLRKHKIPFKGIVCGKPLCYRIVDDRAINAHRKSWI